MKKKSIVFIFGTRPEAIKLVPIIIKLRRLKLYDVSVCVTAQHRTMLDQVLSVFNIKVDIDLNLMKTVSSLADLTCSVLKNLTPELSILKPDLAIVHGDTTTTMASSLACFYNKIPVAHVEAGLRTGNIYAPWPEEINRKLAGCIAVLHFAPTVEAQKNLLSENIKESSVFVTGNTVIDTLFLAKNVINGDKKLFNKLSTQFSFINKNKTLILVTAHRRESFGNGIKSICDALVKISKSFNNIQIVFPVHYNPAVRNPVYKLLEHNDSINLIEPLEYISFVYLMSLSHIILTDSGGIQEEAPSLSKPVLVMRDTTERPDAIKNGTSMLVGTDPDKIYHSVTQLLTDHDHYDKMSLTKNPFGDGKASKRIIDQIKVYLSSNS